MMKFTANTTNASRLAKALAPQHEGTTLAPHPEGTLFTLHPEVRAPLFFGASLEGRLTGATHAR